MEGVNQIERIHVEGGSDFRPWDELIPDALGLIFKDLPLEEVLQVIPRVCKSWGKVVKGPYSWKRIDIDEWCSRNESNYYKIGRMLRMLITRSSGSLQELSVSSVKYRKLFLFIAKHAGSLKTLTLKRSTLSNSRVEQLAAKLSSVTSLDVSDCYGIGTPALEAIGRSCKMLKSLSWNMHSFNSEDMSSHEDEARVIARTMPKLKHLSIGNLNINTQVVLEILSGCPELELLDIQRCWEVTLDAKLLEEKYPKVKVVGPLEVFEFSDEEMDSFEERTRDNCWAEELMYRGDFDNEENFYSTDARYDDEVLYLDDDGYKSEEYVDDDGYCRSPLLLANDWY